jgi:hypothetical protein
MVSLTKYRAEKLLLVIRKRDFTLFSLIKSLVKLKIIGRLYTSYAEGDLSALSKIIVARNVPMDAIINPQSCDPYAFNTCNFGG